MRGYKDLDPSGKGSFAGHLLLCCKISAKVYEIFLYAAVWESVPDKLTQSAKPSDEIC